jgi:hypothetical protein
VQESYDWSAIGEVASVSMNEQNDRARMIVREIPPMEADAVDGLEPAILKTGFRRVPTPLGELGRKERQELIDRSDGRVKT